MHSRAPGTSALQTLRSAAIDAPELRALALAGSAWAEAVVGDPRRAEKLLAAVQRLPEARDDPALATELALLRAMSLMRAGRLADSERQSVAAAQQARRAERVDLMRVALNTAASAAAASGDHEAALAHAERDGCGARRTGVGLGRVLADRALVPAEQRPGGEARAVADEAARIATELCFDGYRPVLERVDATSAAHARL